MAFADLYRSWPTGVVPYCYQPSAAVTGFPQSGSSQFIASVQMVDAAVAKYEAIPYAAIDFQGGGLCANWSNYQVGTDPGTLRILITNSNMGTRYCTMASIAQGETLDEVCDGGEDDEVVVDFGLNYGGGPGNGTTNPEAGILHELGHALGFEHEYYRRSSTFYCMEDDTLGSMGYGGGEPWAITMYDNQSVMNATYCHGNKVFSRRDNAGFAYVYPGTGADRLAVPFSFLIGGKLVTGAPTSANIEYQARLDGVWDFHFTSTEWYRGSTVVAEGSFTSLASALGSNSEAVITGAYVDDFGRNRSSPATTIRRDPGLASALLMASAD